MDPQRARELLERERERLQNLKGSLQGGDLRDETEAESLSELSSYDQHPADIGSETFEWEKEVSIRIGVEDELTELDRAFERLERGSYGICEACGRPIPDARLEAIPFARFCVEDQAAAERQALA